jgi:Fibrobacter succinogenes major domain (Fib_succ_major).
MEIKKMSSTEALKIGRVFGQFVLVFSFLFVAFSCNKENPISNNNIVGTVTDADGNTYQTVKIGTQVWMAENLRTTKYNDGTTIPHVTDSAAWCNLTTPGFCYYNNITNSDSIKKWGALYNWYAVNTGKLSHKGWHVSDTSDWNTLKNYLISNGYNYDRTSDSNKIAKSMATKTDWVTSTATGAIGNDLNKNNSSGFSALPGGICNSGSSGIGSYGYWWCYTEPTITEFRQYGYRLCNNTIDLYLNKGGSHQVAGCSVRLVMD